MSFSARRTQHGFVESLLAATFLSAALCADLRLKVLLRVSMRHPGTILLSWESIATECSAHASHRTAASPGSTSLRSPRQSAPYSHCSSGLCPQAFLITACSSVSPRPVMLWHYGIHAGTMLF